MYIYIYIYIYVCVCVCMCVCIHVYKFVYACVHSHTSRFSLQIYAHYIYFRSIHAENIRFRWIFQVKQRRDYSIGDLLSNIRYRKPGVASCVMVIVLENGYLNLCPNSASDLFHFTTKLITLGEV